MRKLFTEYEVHRFYLYLWAVPYHLPALAIIIIIYIIIHLFKTLDNIKISCLVFSFFLKKQNKTKPWLLCAHKIQTKGRKFNSFSVFTNSLTKLLKEMKTWYIMWSNQVNFSSTQDFFWLQNYSIFLL
jgi:hypothetical protein